MTRASLAALAAQVKSSLGCQKFRFTRLRNASGEDPSKGWGMVAVWNNDGQIYERRVATTPPFNDSQIASMCLSLREARENNAA